MYKITKRKDRNTYQVRFTKDENGLLTSLKRKSGFTSFELAKKWADNTYHDYKNNLFIAKDIIGINAIQVWLDDQKELYNNGVMAKQQYLRKHKYAEKFLQMLVGGIPIKDWKLSEIVSQDRTVASIKRQLIKQVRDLPLAIKTQKDYYYAFKSIFRFFYEEGYTKQAALGNDKTKDYPHARQSNKKAVVISKDVINKILDHTNPRYKFITEFAAYTGIRQGELLELRWRDIDFEKLVINIERSLQKYGVVWDTKTTSSQRVIKIPQTLLLKLKQYKIKSGNSNDDDLVFNGKRKGRIQPRTLLNSIKSACKLAKVDYIVWHDLRHYYASMLLKAYGRDLNYVTNAMGHSNIKVTKSRYEHDMHDQKENEMHSDKLDKLFY